MNRLNGSTITAMEHIKQSIEDILTTRLGTRIARREYGSLLPELIDHPQNDATRLRLYAATVMALMRWELTEVDRQERIHAAPPNCSGMRMLNGSLLSTRAPVSSSSARPLRPTVAICTWDSRTRGSQRIRAMAVAA